MRNVVIIFVSIAVFILAFVFFRGAGGSEPKLYAATDTSILSPIQMLGKFIFFDTQLSNPQGVSCATCHHPDAGFSDIRKTSFSVGSTSVFGNRNAPALAYSAFSPYRYFDEEDETFVGGYFWDGRAIDLTSQVSGPLFNHTEMNVGSKTELLSKINSSHYRELFVYIFGEAATTDTIAGFNAIVSAIARYEESSEMSPFTSKFDYYVQGKATLTKQELWGLELFNDPEKGNCAACHPSTPDNVVGKILFTDFTYDNIGIPAHVQASEIDLGLGMIMNAENENGKFKVPTLRNVAITAPYFHNGSITNLNDAVEFYNNRDKGHFGPPEIISNLNSHEMHDLDLSASEVSAIVAFLYTLTDGWRE
jgi:cytochrome c peroxidase